MIAIAFVFFCCWSSENVIAHQSWRHWYCSDCCVFVFANGCQQSLITARTLKSSVPTIEHCFNFCRKILFLDSLMLLNCYERKRYGCCPIGRKIERKGNGKFWNSSKAFAEKYRKLKFSFSRFLLLLRHHLALHRNACRFCLRHRNIASIGFKWRRSLYFPRRKKYMFLLPCEIDSIKLVRFLLNKLTCYSASNALVRNVF